MSKTEEYLGIISETILLLIQLRKSLNQRVSGVFLTNEDYITINSIKMLLSQLEELDSI